MKISINFERAGLCATQITNTQSYLPVMYPATSHRDSPLMLINYSPNATTPSITFIAYLALKSRSIYNFIS